jgi:hypothetical protein
MAQTPTLTVTSASATVHKTPSVASPVIGQVPIGSAIEVRRELGSWVAVSWGTGAGNNGYIHVSKGKIANGSATGTSYVAAAVAATAAAFTSISQADHGTSTATTAAPGTVTPDDRKSGLNP